MIRKTGEFVINLTTEKLAYATDTVGYAQAVMLINSKK